ncbi:MAG TPA: 6-phosphofructokinase [Clostridiales bacterium]|nr:6-phosphofructokinase [Clostridiales bacterium]
MNRIGVLTSGGDAPGMNAAVRATVRTARYYGIEVYGIERGWDGLIKGNLTELENRSVSDIIQRGGTFLKTARCPEFTTIEGQKKAAETLEAYGIDGLVVIGGDGSFRGAKDISDNFGVKCMGIPGTIDNDLAYTDYTLGFDTAVNTVLSAINNLRDTMQSHDRVSIVEVMGRHCGDIALYSGIAGGAEYILIPEKPYDLDAIAKSLVKSKLRGKTSNMLVLAEGAGDLDEIVNYLNEHAHVDIKRTHLGHVQRGGSPTMADRILATRLAVKAVEALMDDKSVSSAIGIRGNQVVCVPFEEAFQCKKVFNEELYAAANILSK